MRGILQMRRIEAERPLLYGPEPIEAEKLEAVLEAGRLAPTACDNQPFRIVVIETRGREAELKKVYDKAWFAAAPLVLLVCALPSEAWSRKDGKNYAGRRRDYRAGPHDPRGHRLGPRHLLGRRLRPSGGVRGLQARPSLGAPRVYAPRLSEGVPRRSASQGAGRVSRPPLGLVDIPAIEPRHLREASGEPGREGAFIHPPGPIAAQGRGPVHPGLGAQAEDVLEREISPTRRSISSARA